MQVYAIYCMRT